VYPSLCLYNAWPFHACVAFTSDESSWIPSPLPLPPRRAQIRRWLCFVDCVLFCDASRRAFLHSGSSLTSCFYTGFYIFDLSSFRNIPDAPSSQVSQSETSETFRCPSLLVYRSSPTQTRQTDHHRWTQVCDWRMLPDGFSRRQTFVFIAVSDHLHFSFFLSPSSPLPLVIISFSVFCDLLFCIPTRLSALQISNLQLRA